MTTYEYKWVGSLEKINELGSQGWRVVHADQESEYNTGQVLMERIIP